MNNVLGFWGILIDYGIKNKKIWKLLCKRIVAGIDIFQSICPKMMMKAIKTIVNIVGKK